MRWLVASIGILATILMYSFGFLPEFWVDTIKPGSIEAQDMGDRLRSPPLQTATTRTAFDYHEFRITPRAEYDITARVFSTRRYHWNVIDQTYRILPEDLALGWGPLSDFGNARLLHIHQEDRFFKYRWRGSIPFTRDEMITSMANTHIAPATDAIAARLKDIRPGDIVRLRGPLIDIANPGHYELATSLVRTDTGPGACEILWLESVEIERP